MNVHKLILPIRIFGALFLLPTIVAAGLAIWFYTSTSAFIWGAMHTTGKVVQMQAVNGSDGTQWKPLIEFTDSAGNTQHTTSGWATNPPSYAVGQTVQLLYPPGQPSEVRIDRFMELWSGTVICAIIAVPPLVPAFIFIWLIPFAIHRVCPRPARAQPPPLPAA